MSSHSDEQALAFLSQAQHGSALHAFFFLSKAHESRTSSTSSHATSHATGHATSAGTTIFVFFVPQVSLSVLLQRFAAFFATQPQSYARRGSRKRATRDHGRTIFSFFEYQALESASQAMSQIWHALGHASKAETPSAFFVLSLQSFFAFFATHPQCFFRFLAYLGPRVRTRRA